MLKIAVVGGPCSGKSSFVRALVNELGSQGVNGREVSIDYYEEYPRSYIRETMRPLCEAEQYYIQDKILEKERHLERTKCDIIVCDSAAFSTYVYAVRYPGTHRGATPEHEQHKRVKMLQELHTRALETNGSYDIIFFAEPVPPREDGVRFNVGEAKEIGDQIEGYLKLHQLPYIVLEAHPRSTPKESIRRRVTRAMDVIAKHPKTPR